MNLIDAVVTEILSVVPYKKYDRWWVDVSYNSYGVPGTTSLMFKTQEEAENVHVGYDFLT